MFFCVFFLANLPRKDPELQQDFVDFLKKEFNIEKTEDWYSLSHREISKLWKTSPFTLPIMMELIKSRYPEINLQKITSLRFKKSQFLLYNMLQRIFPNQEILQEFRHPQITNEKGQTLELDIFLPQLQIAIEYQVNFCFFFNIFFPIFINKYNKN